MASSASCSSNALLVAVVAAASPAAAQSSHLARLEAAVPAIAPDPVSAAALGGWASAWLVPASGVEVTGVLVGVEHSGFAAITTVFAAAQVDVGPVVQVRFAQSRVKDLFDEELLAEFPGLGALRAGATQVGLDGLLGLGRGAAVSLGGQYERDEFLGDAASMFLARASATGPVLLGVRSAVGVERVVAGGRFGEPGAGRLRMGLARTVDGRTVSLTLGAGATIGDLWAANARSRAIATSLRVAVLGLLTLSGAVGAERDLFGQGGWLGFASFGLGLSLGSVGADFRRGGVGAAEAAPTAVSVLYQPGG